MADLKTRMVDALRQAHSRIYWYAENGEGNSVDRPDPDDIELISEIGSVLLAYDVQTEATPKGEVKSNRAWREEAQLLRAENARLQAIIRRLALIPADDFYKTGDYAAGLMQDAYIEARDGVIK